MGKEGTILLRAEGVIAELAPLGGASRLRTVHDIWLVKGFAGEDDDGASLFLSSLVASLARDHLGKRVRVTIEALE